MFKKYRATIVMGENYAEAKEAMKRLFYFEKQLDYNQYTDKWEIQVASKKPIDLFTITVYLRGLNVEYVRSFNL